MQGKLIDFNAVAGSFTAYASVFGNLDLTGDIVERGAFAKTIRDAQARKAASGGRFLWPLLSMHNTDRPIGGIETAVEDSHGLKITGIVDVSVPAGQSAYAGMKAGYSNQFSIGYDTVRSTRDSKGVRHLTEVKLWEISLITLGFAANQLASVDPVSVKSADDLRPAIERMMNVMVKDMRDWRAQRPMLAGSGAPARAPYVATDDDPAPSRLSYITERQYAEAVDDWMARRNSQAVLRQAQAQRAADFQKAVTVARDQRVCRGLATLAEQRAYADDYGHGPDGQQYADESERVMRAYRAIYAELDAGDD